MSNIINNLAIAAKLLGLDISVNVATTEPKSAPIVSAPKQTSAPKKSPKSDEIPGFVSLRYSDLLDCIQYDPEGKFSGNRLGNVFGNDEGVDVKWFCAPKPVGMRDKNGKVVKIAENAFDRLTTSIARKWALERDWIPEYRYTLEDNAEVVGETILENIKNGADRSKIIGECFHALDREHGAMKPDYHKTDLRETTCNDADRFAFATLFTGTTETLVKLLNLKGEEMPLPTETSLEQYTTEDMEALENLKVLFKRTKEAHPSASVESWLSAQCFALNMPTREAVTFIYGDRANGKKKYRRCEVSYSRMKEQVFGWLLEEAEKMFAETTECGLGKWITILNRIRNINEANRLLEIVKKYGLMTFDPEGEREAYIKEVIIINPMKMINAFKSLIDEANTKFGCNLLEEELSTIENDDIDEEEVVAEIAVPEGIVLPF